MFLFIFLAAADSCSANDTCLANKSPSEAGHGHFFCCCTSDMCNANFEAKVPIPQPVTETERPPKGNDFTPVVIVCIVIAAFVVITGIILFFVSIVLGPTVNFGPEMV